MRESTHVVVNLGDILLVNKGRPDEATLFIQRVDEHLVFIDKQTRYFGIISIGQSTDFKTTDDYGMGEETGTIGVIYNDFGEVLLYSDREHTTVEIL